MVVEKAGTNAVSAATSAAAVHRRGMGRRLGSSITVSGSSRWAGGELWRGGRRGHDHASGTHPMFGDEVTKATSEKQERILGSLPWSPVHDALGSRFRPGLPARWPGRQYAVITVLVLCPHEPT
ncbi:hypothetical protein Pma05_71400 [Plantactinospora mayteni]|uniref:Uncharacterized protein n=1 Tax=Plantactinospora mayteni TaxID=566021 RepID=A0ABQ4F0X7_9ACTN|nr:hypothetical protein Pma05_71400 [Plantactinospora mayteni]